MGLSMEDGVCFTFPEGAAIAHKHAQNPELGSRCYGVVSRSGNAKERRDKANHSLLHSWRTKLKPGEQS